MVTTAFCVRGYWLTGRPNNERRPRTTMSRLTTIASTGRLMKTSVNFMPWPRCLVEGSLFLRVRVRAVGRLHRVVDGHRRAVLQLDLPARDDGLALLQAGED